MVHLFKSENMGAFIWENCDFAMFLPTRAIVLILVKVDGGMEVETDHGEILNGRTPVEEDMSNVLRVEKDTGISGTRPQPAHTSGERFVELPLHAGEKRGNYACCTPRSCCSSSEAE